MDCTNLNSDEALELFHSVFPNYPSVEPQQQIWLAKAKEALHNLIIVDKPMAEILDLPDRLIEVIERGRLGILPTKNPLLVYIYSGNEAYEKQIGSKHVGGIYFHRDFRGFLANDDFVIYCGDNYKVWKASRGDAYGSAKHHWREWNVGGRNSLWGAFSSPYIIDITELVCGVIMENKFINWPNDNPFEVK